MSETAAFLLTALPLLLGGSLVAADVAGGEPEGAGDLSPEAGEELDPQG